MELETTSDCLLEIPGLQWVMYGRYIPLALGLSVTPYRLKKDFHLCSTIDSSLPFR